MVSTAAPLPVTVGLRSKVGGFVALTKPRIIELLLVTTVPVMVVAERGWPSTWLVVATVIGGTLSAGGANAVNMYVDRDIDAVMERTSNRPLVTGVVSPGAALVFAVGIEAVSFAWLWVFVNLVSAVLALSAAAFYVFIYTLWLKRTSRQNIVIGGAAGAMPTLIGWTAVTGELAWAPVLLFAFIFFWTPPHFWALAIKYKDDYARAGVPMLPSVADHEVTARQIIGYSVVVAIIGVAFGPAASLGPIYTVTAALTGLLFVWYAVQTARSESAKVALRLFTYSITYVTLVFAAMAVDVLVRFGF